MQMTANINLGLLPNKNMFSLYQFNYQILNIFLHCYNSIRISGIHLASMAWLGFLAMLIFADINLLDDVCIRRI